MIFQLLKNNIFIIKASNATWVFLQKIVKKNYPIPSQSPILLEPEVVDN